MELTKEQITEFELSEEQVGKINTWSDETIAETVANTKKEFDGKANADAEKILTGAATKILEDTKIERNKGEKMGDYIPRAWNEFNTAKITEVSKAKEDYEDKVKNFKGDEAKDKKINDLEIDLDDFKQKYADFDELKEKAEKYGPLSEKYEANKKEVAFNSVKPSFSKEANEWEVTAKWREFKKGILEKFDLEIVDGEAIAIDKENEHRRKKLSELVKKDESITTLTEGRKQKGPGAKEIKLVDFKDVPFKVPEGAEKDSEIRTKAVRDHLVEKGIAPLDERYTPLFRKYNNAIQIKKE